MAEFNNIIVTNKGQELLTKAIAESKRIEFTRAATATDIYDVTQSLELEMLSEVQSVGISKIVPNGLNKYKITVAVENSNLQEGYYLNTIGIYAKIENEESEILYAVVSANESKGIYMAAYNKIRITGVEFNLTLAISNTNNFILEVSPSAIATQQDISDLYEQIEAKTQEINIINEKVFHIEEGYTKAHVYGIRRSLDARDSLWEKILDNIGLDVSRAEGANIFDDDKIYPWCEIKTCNYDTYLKKVVAWLGEPHFRFDGSNGEVLVRIPEFYWCRTRDEENEYIFIADKKIDETYDFQEFSELDLKFIKSEEFFVSRYLLSVDDLTYTVNKHVCSYSNNTKTDLKNTQTLNSIREIFRRTNLYNIMDWHYFLIQLLYLVEYADYNTENTFGIPQELTQIQTGICDEFENYSCENCGRIMYRGIEDIFMTMPQYIDGIQKFINDGFYYTYNRKNYLEANPLNTLQIPAPKLNYEIPENISGNIISFGYDEENPLFMLPSIVSDTEIGIGSSYESAINHSYGYGCVLGGKNSLFGYNLSETEGGTTHTITVYRGLLI